jgi:hypothetical protein
VAVAGVAHRAERGVLGGGGHASGDAIDQRPVRALREQVAGEPIHRGPEVLAERRDERTDVLGR